MTSWNKIRWGLPLLVLTAALAVDVHPAQAQFKIHTNSYYYYPAAPVPVTTGPMYLQYSPSTSSYYMVPMAQVPLPTAGVTQNYSFYSYPNLTYFPPGIPNYTPSFPSTSVYYPVDPLAPYVSHSPGSNVLTPYVLKNSAIYSTSPYNTPTFYRY